MKVKVFQGHKDTVKSCRFCADDQKALTSSFDKTVKLWHLDDGTLLKSYQGHDLNVSQAHPDPTGDRLVLSVKWH